MQVNLGFFFKIYGKDSLLIKGIFDVLKPLLANYIDVGVLLVRLTPNKIISDLFKSSICFPSSWFIVNYIASIQI